MAFWIGLFILAELFFLSGSYRAFRAKLPDRGYLQLAIAVVGMPILFFDNSGAPLATLLPENWKDFALAIWILVVLIICGLMVFRHPKRL